MRPPLLPEPRRHPCIRAGRRGARLPPLGFSEHVASSPLTAVPPGFAHDDPWHETATLTGFLAGVTETIDLSPAVMLVTLRHPVLVAKQLAELQLLSGNRLRVAASVGWNKEELRGLRVEPSTRGARLDEALPLIRHLLTEESVTHTGEHYRIDQLGIHPRPTTPPEIWVGGGNFDTMGSPGERAMRRVARLADGFKLMAPTGRDVDNALRLAERLHEHAAEAGRTLSIEARLLTQVTAPEDWAGVVRRYRESGLITQLGLGNRIVGGPVAEQLALLENVAACTRSEWQ